MWTCSKSSVLAFLVVSTACSSKSDDTQNGAASNVATGGTSTGGTSSGGTSGTGANTGGSAANSGTPTGFCVLGAQGCPCDATRACSPGLTCNGNTCCDAAGSCAVPPDQGGSSTDPGTGTGTGSGGTKGGPGGPGDPGSGGSAPATVCTPGVVGPVITDCGYPYESSNPLTNVAFNESEVLRAIAPSGGAPLASVRLFYNDEHALTLGVRSVSVQSASGTATHDFPVSELSASPSALRSPVTGTNDLTGEDAGVDPEGRPMWPALFVTDTTVDQENRSGDWQMGGTAWNPSAIFGTWKAAVRSVDTTVTPNLSIVTPDADPAKNDWNLGGGDPIPASLTGSAGMSGMGMKGMGMMGMAKTSEGYGTEVRWDVVLVAGHSYRIQVMVHDGDQNKVGGDTGEACVNFCADAACPDGSLPCSADSPCPIETESICVSGCCI